MQTIFIFFIVYHLPALHGGEIFHEEIYAEIGSEVILSCISKNASTQSWRTDLLVLTQGFEINRSFRGHERLDVIADESFYNLKICNITEHDFVTYWCDMQQGNSITAEGTRLIQSVTSTVNLYEDTTTDSQRKKIQSTLSGLSTSETKDSTGTYVGQSFYIGLFTTGLAVLCLSVGCNYSINKYRAMIMKRKERSSDDNEHQDDVLQANSTNNATANVAVGENQNEISHYEMINENELIEMSHPTTSLHLSNLPRDSNIVQSIQPDNMYLEVIEDINNQKLDPSTKMNRDEDQVSILKGSQREERNTSIFIFPTKNEKDGSSNTIHKESVVTIEANNFEVCKTSNNSISVTSSTSEQSADDHESIQERDKTACEYLSQYTSLNVNDMEYLNSYSTPITENKLRKSGSQNSNTSECPGKNEQY